MFLLFFHQLTQGKKKKPSLLSLSLSHRPLYNIDGGGSMQYQSMNNNNNNNNSFDQNESMMSVPSERRKRSEPLVASPQWKATHHTKARSIRPAPHQRFSMSLRWLIQKKQQKDLAAQASTVNTDASVVASTNDKDAKKSDAKKRGGTKMSGTKMRTAGVVDGVMRRNSQDEKEKNKNDGETETKRTKSKKKTIIKKKTSKKDLDSSFDLDSELAALQQEFAEL